LRFVAEASHTRKTDLCYRFIMAEIYGLFSGRDGAVRYVGETTYPRATRFRQHRREAWLRSRPLHHWLNNEWKHGFPVRCIRLEWCTNEERFRRETDWIAKFPNLLNERKYSGWMQLLPRGARPPQIPEITKYIRGHRFNVDGRRGIHYQISMDRYFVLIYTGSDFEWLEGDEPVGGGGNIWFSDLAAAENARDRHYKFRPHLRRLPDFRVEAI
jgi:hypothetical protein